MIEVCCWSILYRIFLHTQPLSSSKSFSFEELRKYIGVDTLQINRNYSMLKSCFLEKRNRYFGPLTCITPLLIFGHTSPFCKLAILQKYPSHGSSDKKDGEITREFSGWEWSIRKDNFQRIL